MAMLRNLLWLVVFLISTLSFVVLFEKGTTNFQANLQSQVTEFASMAKEQLNPPKPEKGAH